MIPTYPNENANKSWLAFIKDLAYLIWKIAPYLPSVLPGRTTPRSLKVRSCSIGLMLICSQAVEELRAEGYERIGAIGQRASLAYSLQYRLTLS